MHVPKRDHVFIEPSPHHIRQIAIPYAKSQGLFVTVSGSGSARALANRLGADEFIDYETQDYTDILRDYDYVIDTRGGGMANMVPVGAWSLANPDLVERLKLGAPLNEADPNWNRKRARDRMK